MQLWWLQQGQLQGRLKPVPVAAATTVIQLVQLAMLYQYLSFLNFLLAQFFIQALIMFGYFTLYWAYAW